MTVFMNDLKVNPQIIKIIPTQKFHTLIWSTISMGLVSMILLIPKVFTISKYRGILKIIYRIITTIVVALLIFTPILLLNITTEQGIAFIIDLESLKFLL